MASKTSPNIRSSCFSHFLSILLILCFHVTLSVKIQPGIFELDFMDYLSTSLQDPEVELMPSRRLTPGKYYHAVMKSAFANTPVHISIDEINDYEEYFEVEYSLGWEIRYTTCEGVYENAAEVGGTDFIQVLYNQHNYMFPGEDFIFVQGKEDDPSKKRTSWIPYEAFPKLSNSDPNVDGTCYVRKENMFTYDCLEGVYQKEDDTGYEKEDYTGYEKEDYTSDEKEDYTDYENIKWQRTNFMFTMLCYIGDSLLIPEYVVNDQQSKQLEKIQMTLKYLTFVVLVRVEMKGPHGYLSAFQYPLLKFYCIMCGLYILLGFTWSLLLCYQDKLRGIHIWIGAVVFVGLVEKAAFFAEFEHVNNYGKVSQTGVLLPELVSCLKRTLTRLLVVVVSIGYGITRPSFGNNLRYIIAVGLIYMVVSSAEAIIQSSNGYVHSLAATIPLALLNLVFFFWILISLLNTFKTLRLRKNEVQLWRYCYFTCALILCIISSFIFFLWSVKTHSFNECISSWHGLWLDDAFWHILGCVILLAVMVLFRPSINRQCDDEDNKELMLSEFCDDMSHQDQGVNLKSVTLTVTHRQCPTVSTPD